MEFPRKYKLQVVTQQLSPLASPSLEVATTNTRARPQNEPASSLSSGEAKSQKIVDESFFETGEALNLFGRNNSDSPTDCRITIHQRTRVLLQGLGKSAGAWCCLVAGRDPDNYCNVTEIIGCAVRY